MVSAQLSLLRRKQVADYLLPLTCSLILAHTAISPLTSEPSPSLDLKKPFLRGLLLPALHDCLPPESSKQTPPPHTPVHPRPRTQADEGQSEQSQARIRCLTRLTPAERQDKPRPNSTPRASQLLATTHRRERTARWSSSLWLRCSCAGPLRLAHSPAARPADLALHQRVFPASGVSVELSGVGSQLSSRTCRSSPEQPAAAQLSADERSSKLSARDEQHDQSLAHQQARRRACECGGSEPSQYYTAAGHALARRPQPQRAFTCRRRRVRPAPSVSGVARLAQSRCLLRRFSSFFQPMLFCTQAQAQQQVQFIMHHGDNLTDLKNARSHGTTTCSQPFADVAHAQRLPVFLLD